MGDERRRETYNGRPALLNSVRELAVGAMVSGEGKNRLLAICRTNLRRSGAARHVLSAFFLGTKHPFRDERNTRSLHIFPSMTFDITAK